MPDVAIRNFCESDRETLKRLTIEAFAGVTLEQNVEDFLGILNGHDWRWRKARHIDDDIASNPDGIFIAEIGGAVAGYISTTLDREAGKGRIPNLAVSSEFRDRGIGRRLIEYALDYFRSEGIAYAVIETMAQNPVGQHLYPACGFIEVARQVHFARRI
jgi:ribosomal protein S18 acetylase RimI-like enzyme